MDLNAGQRLRLATLLGYIQQAPLPVREVGWEEQGYWGKPIAQSTITPIPSSPTWQTIQQVRNPIGYNSIVREFLATPLNLPYPANLRFRISIDDTLIPNTAFTAGVDRSHAPTFPLIRQKTNLVISLFEVITMQCLNQSGNALQVASGFWGWHYYDPWGEISGDGESRIDVASLAGNKAMEMVDE